MTVKTDSLPVLIKKADEVFSKWIRARDTRHDGYIYCFICNQRLRPAVAHNGHWQRRGKMPTRYDESNCHSVCESCNWRDELEPQHYDAKMDAEYGEVYVDQLKIKSNTLAKFTRYELLEIIEKYKK